MNATYENDEVKELNRNFLYSPRPHMHISTIIGRLYRILLKPILFLFPPETMHTVFGHVGARLGRFSRTRKCIRRLFHYSHPSLEQTICGIHFPNPVGLAAWFDKDILLPNIIGDVGFGREECGSITKDAYAWNPWKRLYRLKKSRGLVVNYGLKNNGVTYAKEKIERARPGVPLFVSIAKTNCTQTCDYQAGIDDYVASLECLAWVRNIQGCVLNISCPNAFWWEDYTAPDRLAWLLKAVEELYAHNKTLQKPHFVKLPVDKSREQTKALIEVCIEHNITWIILSNLTKYREDIIEKNEIADMPGGISGKPTQHKSDYLIWKTYETFGKRIIIVWVGGIFSAEDAYQKIKQGASLVQLITGMIYQGPQLIWEVNRWIAELLRNDWYKHIREAIGANIS